METRRHEVPRGYAVQKQPHEKDSLQLSMKRWQKDAIYEKARQVIRKSGAAHESKAAIIRKVLLDWAGVHEAPVN
jgi:hypothetical protein